jgi:hypothetical protein
LAAAVSFSRSFGSFPWRNESVTQQRLTLVNIREYRFEIEAVFRREPFAYFVHFFDDGIFPHDAILPLVRPACK